MDLTCNFYSSIALLHNCITWLLGVDFNFLFTSFSRLYPDIDLLKPLTDHYVLSSKIHIVQCIKENSRFVIFLKKLLINGI